jgi:hydrogenase maturation protease
MMPKVRHLVIGYGNTVRSDDGAGYQVAEIVASLNLENVRSLAVHQLTPDLAEQIAMAEVVIFVDAVATSSELKVESLEPRVSESFTGHYADPRSLLSLSHVLYGAAPIAYRILIPALDFTFGETFSRITRLNISLALAKIKQLILASTVQQNEHSLI